MKIGDKVRVIKDTIFSNSMLSSDTCLIGQEGKIIEIDHTALPINVRLENDRFTTPFKEEELEFIQEA